MEEKKKVIEYYHFKKPVDYRKKDSKNEWIACLSLDIMITGQRHFLFSSQPWLALRSDCEGDCDTGGFAHLHGTFPLPSRSRLHSCNRKPWQGNVLQCAHHVSFAKSCLFMVKSITCTVHLDQLFQRLRPNLSLCCHTGYIRVEYSAGIKVISDNFGRLLENFHPITVLNWELIF